MKTAKGNTFQVLMSVLVSDNTIAFNTANPVGFSLGEPLVSKIAEWASDVISRDVKPSSGLAKQLERVELHREQLIDAYSKIVDYYNNAVTPQTRTSSRDKAMYDFLKTMPDKMLLSYAETVNVSEDILSDTILPDDREKLTEAIAERLKAQTQ